MAEQKVGGVNCGSKLEQTLLQYPSKVPGLLALGILAACAAQRNPYATTNFNLRKPNYVVIHYTAQDSTA